MIADSWYLIAPGPRWRRTFGTITNSTSRRVHSEIRSSEVDLDLELELVLVLVLDLELEQVLVLVRDLMPELVLASINYQLTTWHGGGDGPQGSWIHIYIYIYIYI